MGKIIIVEDSVEISNVIKLYLNGAGHEVHIAEDGLKGLELCKSEGYDLGIFDLMLPEIDGFQLIESVRQFSNMPILILSAKTEDYDKIKGFELGADDYIQKPFNPIELVARVNASLRRWGMMNTSTSEILTLGMLTMDLDQHLVKVNNEIVDLTASEYKILKLLMKAPGRVFTKEQIAELIHGEYFESDANAIMVHISHIREKIGFNQKGKSYIKTVRGLGYKIEN